MKEIKIKSFNKFDNELYGEFINELYNSLINNLKYI